MTQLMLPIIPERATRISNMVCVHRGKVRWTYFLGLHPIYIHSAGDNRMFRIVTSMLIDSGACRHKDITKVFGVSKSSVNRALKKLRKGGVEAFFQRKPGGRKGTVLSPDVLLQAQDLLDRGFTRQEVALELEVRLDTFRKAINDGRLRESAVQEAPVVEGTNKSSRNAVDASAANGLGTACTRV